MNVLFQLLIFIELWIITRNCLDNFTWTNLLFTVVAYALVIMGYYYIGKKGGKK